VHSEFLLVGRKRLSQGDHEGQCLLLTGRQRELEHAKALVEVQVVGQGFGESILVGLPGQGFIRKVLDAELGADRVAGQQPRRGLQGLELPRQAGLHARGQFDQRRLAQLQVHPPTAPGALELKRLVAFEKR